MEKSEKETAIQNEQQLKSTEEIIKEFQDLNRNLKSISNTLLYISQYGIITK